MGRKSKDHRRRLKYESIKTIVARWQKRMRKLARKQ